MAKKVDIEELRELLLGLKPWLDEENSLVEPGQNTNKGDDLGQRGDPHERRKAIATACRMSAALLAQDVPGKAVELRIPPYAAVQCIQGTEHRRGEPPNVVQMNPYMWLSLVTGRIRCGTEEERQKVRRAMDISGNRAEDIFLYLPLIPL